MPRYLTKGGAFFRTIRTRIDAGLQWWWFASTVCAPQGPFSSEAQAVNAACAFYGEGAIKLTLERKVKRGNATANA